MDGSSTDRLVNRAAAGARVHLEPRRGWACVSNRFEVAKGDIIVTMDADCTYPAEKIPELVRKLLDEELEFITCDRLTWQRKERCQVFTGSGTGAVLHGACSSCTESGF